MKISGKLKHVPLRRYLAFQNDMRIRRKEIIVIMEHVPVITAGINYNKENLLVSAEFLQKQGIEFMELKRGGDLTAHESGQLCIYPHLDLKKRGLKISDYSNLLLESVRLAVKDTWGLATVADKKKPGLYLEHAPEKKLVSIGLDCKGYFSSFGVAVNLANSKDVFRLIRPCGEEAENIVTLKMLGYDAARENEFIQGFNTHFRRNLHVGD